MVRSSHRRRVLHALASSQRKTIEDRWAPGRTARRWTGHRFDPRVVRMYEFAEPSPHRGGPPRRAHRPTDRHPRARRTAGAAGRRRRARDKPRRDDLELGGVVHGLRDRCRRHRSFAFASGAYTGRDPMGLFWSMRPAGVSSDYVFMYPADGKAVIQLIARAGLMSDGRENPVPAPATRLAAGHAPSLREGRSRDRLPRPVPASRFPRNRGREPGGRCSRSRRCVAADPVVAGCGQRMSRDRRRSARILPPV